MKKHIGVDSKTRLTHSTVVTSAKVHDSRVMRDRLNGDETPVWRNSAYTGQTEMLGSVAPDARDFTQKKGSRYHKLCEVDRVKNRNKFRVQTKLEYVFGVMKRQFGYNKRRYRGLDKNAQALLTRSAPVNLVITRKQLLGA